MEGEEIARAVAAELAPEVGAPLKGQTERAIKGTLPPPDAATRGLREAADLAVIAHFIWTVAPVAASMWKDRSQHSDTVRAALDRLQRPASISAETAKRVIDAVVAKLKR
jgi:hypothetical protein